MLPVLLASALAALALAVLFLRRRTPAVAVPEVVPVPLQPPPQTRGTVLAEAIPAPPRISGEVSRPKPVLAPLPRVVSSSDALDTLDALLAELESTTVRIDGADALDESSVAELEGLAERLEAAAESLAAR